MCGGGGGGKTGKSTHICLFYLIQQSFSYVETGLSGLDHYLARINVSCSRTQRSNDYYTYEPQHVISNKVAF